MNEIQRQVKITELLICSGIFQKAFGKKSEQIIEGYGRILRYMSFLRLDVKAKDKLNACKQVTKIAGACEKFLDNFATDDMLNAMQSDMETESGVPDDL